MKMGIFYLVLGALFTYMAVVSITDSIWNITTILLLVVAALDFGVGFRYIKTRIANRKGE